MDRKRAGYKFKPVLVGKEEIAYLKACEIARACDNLPPLREEFEKNER